jgi:hypothetical protein
MQQPSGTNVKGMFGKVENEFNLEQIMKSDKKLSSGEWANRIQPRRIMTFFSRLFELFRGSPAAPERHSDPRNPRTDTKRSPSQSHAILNSKF